jgi:hypothetical protein
MQFMYHGTNVTNLKSIAPQNTPYGKSPVFGTKEFLKALIFAREEGIGDAHYDIDFDINNKIILTERIHGVFDKYFDKPGSVYKLHANNFARCSGYQFEYTSSQSEVVQEEFFFPSVLVELKNYSEQGAVQLYFYPNRPSTIPGDDSDLVKKFVKWGFEDIKDGHDIRDLFNNISETHPKLLEKVKSHFDGY